MNANERELILEDQVYMIVRAAMGAWKRMVLSQPNIRVYSRPFAVDKLGKELTANERK